MVTQDLFCRRMGKRQSSFGINLSNYLVTATNPSNLELQKVKSLQVAHFRAEDCKEFDAIHAFIYCIEKIISVALQEGRSDPAKLRCLREAVGSTKQRLYSIIPLRTMYNYRCLCEEFEHTIFSVQEYETARKAAQHLRMKNAMIIYILSRRRSNKKWMRSMISKEETINKLHQIRRCYNQFRCTICFNCNLENCSIARCTKSKYINRAEQDLSA